MISSTYVLAESFDAMPLHLYDTVEAFTAPVLEPDYLDHTTCLHCDDSGHIQAVNQFHQDVLAPCPHCEGGKVESKQVTPPTKPQPRFNMPAIYLYLYSKMPEDKMTIWEKKHYESLRAA